MDSAVARTVPTDLLRRHQTLLEVGEVIHAFRDVNELFRHLADCLRPLLICNGMAVGLLNDDKVTIRLALAENWGTFPPEIGRSAPLSAVPAEIVITEQRPVRFTLHDHEQAARYPLHADILRMAGWQTSYAFPLTTSMTQLGAIGCLFKEDVHLTEQELDFFQKVADQVAVAIENSQNFEKARLAQEQVTRERDRSRLLLEINNAVVSHLNLRELLKSIASSVRRIIPNDAAFLTLCDGDGTHVQLQALDLQALDKVPVQEGLRAPMEGTPEGEAITSQRPVLVSRIDLKRFFSPWVKQGFESGIRSGCAVPLIAHGRPLGALSVVSMHENAFNEEDAKLLEQCSSQVAIAIENSLNFERVKLAEQEKEKERDRLQLLMDVNNHLASNLELRDLLQATVASVRRLMQCDIVTIHLPSADGAALHTSAMDFPDGRLVLEESEDTPLEGTLHGEVFRSAQPISQARIDAARFPVEAEFLATLDIVGGCIVPMIHRGQVRGNLGLGRREEKAFTQDEIDFLSQLGTQVAIAIENALAYREIGSLKEKLAQEKLYLEDEISSEINFKEIVGESPTLKAALEKVATVALSDATVLILGETGTGKELIARAIHDASRRKGRTFVKLNCAAIPTGLLESELFGHEKGAFTGAIAQKIGRMELANGGTLFLDEVGDIPLELQPKLLRALQEREFERLGSVRTQKADVRILAATNRDLQEMVAEKEFRSDLYYRLNVFPIAIPPLRERHGDIPRLIRYFVSKYAKKMDKHIDTIPSASMERLKGWHWPGNVRELENFIERSVILTHGPALHVPLAELAAPETDDVPPITLRETERDHILKILKETRGTLAGPNGAAARLGVKRTTLQYKMKKLGITRDSY